MKAIVLGSAAGLAVAVAASLPAHAQFAYPVIIWSPPPAQNLALPRLAPKPAQPANTTAPPPDASAPDLSRCYQGRVRVCQ